MSEIFRANIYTDYDPDVNQVQMNSLLTSLISQSSFCDCQSQPLKELFGDFYSKARYSVQDTFEKFLKAAPVSLRPSRIFERFVDRTPYADIIQYRAEIPEGLKVTFLEYLEVLQPAQERANNIIKNVIDPFSKFVSKMVSDEVFRNQAGHQIRELSNLEPEYVKVVKDFEKCFAKNDYKSSAGFIEVVKRNNDWKRVFSETVALKKVYDDFPQEELTKKLNRLYEMLDELVEQVKLDQYDSVEKEVTELLSKGMYNVAKEVELAALTTFRTKTFITVIDINIGNLEEMIKHSASDDGDHEFR